MATIRQGYLDDFTLKNQKVGIGTSTANEKLEVLGGTRGEDVVVTGVATLTSYEGFQNKKTSYVDNIHFDSGESGTLSGEIVIGSGTTLSVGTGATTSQGNLKSLKVGNTFIPPCGGTADRPSAAKPGTIYYNKDFRTIEYWDGNFWRQVDNTTRSGRAVFMGGADPSGDLKIIDYFNMSSQGNAVNFGETLTAESRRAGCGSEIRGLSAGSDDSSNHEVIEYITIASEGNSIDFGNMYNGRGTAASFSSSTRGVWAGGRSPSTSQNTIDYVEIPTLGNALDFGDLRNARQWLGGCSSPTRGIIAGGEGPAYASPTRTSDIEYITIASKGNSLLFGEMTGPTGNPGSFSNSVRGIFAGGEPRNYTKIDMINIASTGNAVHFGDLRQGRIVVNGTANQIRGFIMGGRNNGPGAYVNLIESVEIASSGNAVDWGDLTVARWAGASISDSHGGLGGF